MESIALTAAGLGPEAELAGVEERVQDAAEFPFIDASRDFGFVRNETEGVPMWRPSNVPQLFHEN